MSKNERTYMMIREIDRNKMPPKNGKWAAFYREIMLRMERTPPSKALELIFEDWDTATLARNALLQRVYKAHGGGTLRTRLQSLDGQILLYIWRGPNYGK